MLAILVVDGDRHGQAREGHRRRKAHAARKDLQEGLALTPKARRCTDFRPRYPYWPGGPHGARHGSRTCKPHIHRGQARVLRRARHGQRRRLLGGSGQHAEAALVQRLSTTASANLAWPEVRQPGPIVTGVALRLDVPPGPANVGRGLERGGAPRQSQQLPRSGTTSVHGEDLGHVVPEREKHARVVRGILAVLLQAHDGSTSFQ
eukprot:9503796-Pyramimonas_sp.AAC.1